MHSIIARKTALFVLTIAILLPARAVCQDKLDASAVKPSSADGTLP